MHKKPRILVVGSFVMDLICESNRFSKSGETVIGTRFLMATGGKGANQAVQAARLGAEVLMVGKVGKDDFGKQILQSLKDSDVDISEVMYSETCSTGVGNVQLQITDKGTENRILVIPGANMDITENEVEFLKNSIVDYDMVILQLEIPMAVNLAVARLAYENGVPVMLNSAPSSELPDELLKCLTYISPNEHEASDITKIPVTDEASAKKATEWLHNKGVKNVLITMGNKGAVFSDGKQFVSSPCVDFAATVDPTAAGDSFVAAFCTAVCYGDTIEGALLFANHTAGITVSKMGAQPSLPELKDVVEFMKRNNNDVSLYIKE